MIDNISELTTKNPTWNLKQYQFIFFNMTSSNTSFTVIKDEFTEVVTKDELSPTSKPADWNVVSLRNQSSIPYILLSHLLKPLNKG